MSVRYAASTLAVLALAVAGAALLASCLAPGGRNAKAAAAQNARCFVCHTNFQKEKLTLAHSRGGVGCATCHGKSDAHCADENNITAPDILYSRAAIKPACMQCHPDTDIGRRAEHKEVLAGAGPKTCTDCHGNHRLATRTIRWDKTTRQLLKSQ
jgi:hypothetical protein